MRPTRAEDAGHGQPREVRGANLPYGLTGKCNSNMTTYKNERVSEQIQHLIGELLERRVKDPRLAMVNVTSVKLSPTLREATVYVSAMDGAAVKNEVLDGLERAKGFLRREVGQRLKLRNVPELFFRWDESLEAADQVLRLLDDLGRE